MNDDRTLERAIIGAYDASVPSREPAGLLDIVLLTTGRSRQRPRWLALIKEPPMRLTSGLAVGSSTARVTAFVAATILLAILATGAVVAGSSLLTGPAPIVVAQDGSGQYATITDAVAAAADGGTILIRPGTYPEAIIVDKDITIRGDGSRDAIIVEVLPDRPSGLANAPFGIHLLETAATLANLSVVAPEDATALLVTGGAPTVQDLRLEFPGEFPGREGKNAFVYEQGAMGTMQDVTTRGLAFIGSGSSPTITRLDHMNAGIIISDEGTDPVIADSSFSDLVIETSAEPKITGGFIRGASITATDTPVITGATIGNPEWELGEVIDNSAETYGIDIVGARPLLKDNRIGDHPYGIRVMGGAPAIEGNTFEHNDIGLGVISENGMTLTGNTFCGNTVDLEVPDGSAITLDANELCPASASAG
jgi:Pectinesterase